jgi:hypothetical protein
VHTFIKIDYYFPPPFQSSHRVRALSGSLPALSQGQDYVQDNIIVPGLVDPAVSLDLTVQIYLDQHVPVIPQASSLARHCDQAFTSASWASLFYSEIGGCQETTITFNTAALPEVFTPAQVSMHRPSQVILANF